MQIMMYLWFEQRSLGESLARDLLACSIFCDLSLPGLVGQVAFDPLATVLFFLTTDTARH